MWGARGALPPEGLCRAERVADVPDLSELRRPLVKGRRLTVLQAGRNLTGILPFFLESFSEVEVGL